MENFEYQYTLTQMINKILNYISLLKDISKITYLHNIEIDP
jgi:hypothetical protein